MASIIETIKEAMGQLDPGNKEHFNKDGIPSVEQLEALTGIKDIKAKQRDIAWAAYNEEKDKALKEAKDRAALEEAEAKAKEKKKPKKVKRGPGFYVCEGKAVTSRKGICGPGDPVTPEHFRGEGTLENLVERGIVEEVK